MKNAIVKMILKRIDLKGILIEDILEGVAFKKIDEIVLASTNQLDDSMAVLVKPLIKKFLVAYIDDLLAKYSAE